MPRADHLLVTDGAEPRVVGAPEWAMACILINGKVQLVRARDGNRVNTFGKQARALCEGAASNAERFGIAWLEDDGRVWVVHGPTASASADVAPAATAARWCGVASAGRNLMLMWRDGKRMFFNTCTQKACRGYAPSITLDEGTALLGVGCNTRIRAWSRRAPPAPARSSSSSTPRVASSGGRRSTPRRTRREHVAIVGAGDAAFAVGTAGTVLGVTAKGVTTTLWCGFGSPAVAWARGRVAVVAHRSGKLATTTVAYP